VAVRELITATPAGAGSPRRDGRRAPRDAAKITAPVLVIAGKDDIFADPTLFWG
jgi:pimeloyl-ACP methyl ester carboxylesterase